MEGRHGIRGAGQDQAAQGGGRCERVWEVEHHAWPCCCAGMWGVEGRHGSRAMWDRWLIRARSGSVGGVLHARPGPAAAQVGGWVCGQRRWLGRDRERTARGHGRKHSPSFSRRLPLTSRCALVHSISGFRDAGRRNMSRAAPGVCPLPFQQVALDVDLLV